MPDVAPFVLERKIVPKVWGGRSLERVLGIALPGDESVGETWELYDRPDGSSRIRGRNETLRDLLERSEVEIMGSHGRLTPQGLFPLALKFLDAAQPLSVQVHPDDAQAADAGDSGKPEAWLILDAGERARVARGFRKGVTREDFAAVAETAGVVDLLEAFSPSVGDCVRVPPGTVHTIGPDVVMFEIQRNSGVTYRFYDWDRDREVHVEEGLRAARFGVEPEKTVASAPTADGGELLLREDAFELQRFEVSEPRTFVANGRFKLLTLLKGRGMVGWKSQGEHDPVLMQTADTVLVPACVEEVFFSPVGEVSLVVSGEGR